MDQPDPDPQHEFYEFYTILTITGTGTALSLFFFILFLGAPVLDRADEINPDWHTDKNRHFRFLFKGGFLGIFTLLSMYVIQHQNSIVSEDAGLESNPGLLGLRH